MIADGINRGWQCPVCCSVYSPTTPQCMHCGPRYTSTDTGNTAGQKVVIKMTCGACGMRFEPSALHVCNAYSSQAGNTIEIYSQPNVTSTLTEKQSSIEPGWLDTSNHKTGLKT